MGVPQPHFGLGMSYLSHFIFLAVPGLLAGLWEFPSLTLDSECHEVTDYRAVLNKYGLTVNKVSRLINAGEVGTINDLSFRTYSSSSVSNINPRILIRITCLCVLYPLTPHFYIVKLGFTGVYIGFLFFALKHRLWVLIRTASLRRF